MNQTNSITCDSGSQLREENSCETTWINSKFNYVILARLQARVCCLSSLLEKPVRMDHFGENCCWIVAFAQLRAYNQFDLHDSLVRMLIQQLLTYQEYSKFCYY